ncbi:MAG: hypothetical protein HY814_04870 [Candidatus Riflebacteria bacterium]|nr:hypothetical protein [Candidatus Riflebacteria bacterium]
MIRWQVLGLLLSVLFASAALAQTEDPARDFDRLRNSAAATTTPANQPAPTVAQLGPYTVIGQPVRTFHTYFERELDAPDFYNFESFQTYGPFKHKFVNSGTCYGISMFTLRYYQWFILPHLLTDAELAAAKPRKLPAYARRVAKDMGLPDWVLASPADDGKGGKLAAAQRAERIAPYRLRKLLTGKADMTRALQEAIEKTAKVECARMFDNQQLLLNLGARIAQFADRTLFGRVPRDSELGRKFFGVGGFGLMKKYVQDPSLGAFEIGFYGSKLKPMWGHSVVGFRIVQYAARRKGATGTVEAYRIDLYDSNDPTNTSDDCFWFLPSVQAFAPSKAYAAFYDGDNPLLPKGKDFLRSTQLGPSAEQQMFTVEKNTFNQWMFRHKTVGVE